MRFPRSYLAAIFTAGGCHVPLSTGSSGQYIRSIRMNLPAGAGKRTSMGDCRVVDL